VQQPIQLAQVTTVVELIGMISVLFQKKNNHKSQKFLIMIIVQMIQKIKGNQPNNAQFMSKIKVA